MDNEIPLQGNNKGNRRATEKSSDPRMPESRDDDIEWSYSPRSCPPSFVMSSELGALESGKVVQYLKGRSSRLLQDEFSQLKKRYWGQHLWGRGYFCATVGSVTEEMIRDYIEKHAEAGSQITVQGEF